MAMFHIRLVIQRSSARLFYSCIRQRPKILFRARNISNQSVVGSSFDPVGYQLKTQVDAGIDHEEDNVVDSDEEPVKRRKPAQLNMVYDTLTKNQPRSEDEIYNFRNQVINSGNVVTEANVDAIIIGMCTTLKKLEFANSYLNVLEQKNIEINTATYGRYLKLCYAIGKINDESKILDICHGIREKMPLMDASTAENVVHGFSLTSEWRQGLELINMIKETCTPSASTYSALIIAAFKNKELEMGWELMEECLKEGRTPHDIVYFTWLDLFVIQNSDSDSNEQLAAAEKLLNFLSLHELRPSIAVAKKLKYAFESMNWKGYLTYISDRSICNSCKAEMAPILISRSEFKTLSKTFLERVLVGPDVFSKSLPEEVEEFQRLMANEAPYNTVIDGLNVAYSSGGGGKVPPHRCAALLQSVVAHFVDLSHKILVLGRTHMNSWPSKEMDYIRQNSQLFLTQNLSQDDPFLLYAAMKSGPGTCFLSRDLMRSHAHRLKLADPSLSSVFRRWQISHQMRLVGVSHNRRVEIKLPLDYSPDVQKVDGNWHIPYQEEEQEVDAAQEGKKITTLTRSHLDPPTHWLCLSKKQFGGKSKNFYGMKDSYNKGYNKSYNKSYNRSYY